ncbi:hypothetical protein C4D60_Mb06t06880 [Musa balbisiana]|uniref:Uncharacterized protein n=1 Tax=Musa balbisiana TaxID=52838 RepID=A0A4S8IMG2_MUSBA|nr:hypothetical protein C4D60_Mb06t06880 [Musa balbisiana]
MGSGFPTFMSLPDLVGFIGYHDSDSGMSRVFRPSQPPFNNNYRQREGDRTESNSIDLDDS